MSAINRLLTQNKLQMFQSKDKKDEALLVAIESKFKGMTPDDRLVYQLIERAGNKGIWIRELRFQSNIEMNTIKKILRMMESRKLIKSVNSVVSAKKKMYMLFELEPDKSLTGGKWYGEDGELEVEFIDILTRLTFKFIEDRHRQASIVLNWDRTLVSGDDVRAHVERTDFSKVTLDDSDIEAVLDTLVFDGKVEIAATTPRKLYRLSKIPTRTGGFSSTPCGLCPVFKDCGEGAVVSPSTCVYLKEWIEF